MYGIIINSKVAMYMDRVNYLIFIITIFNSGTDPGVDVVATSHAVLNF